MSIEPTCASCGKVVKEDDIIGDGTNRGLCCVPDYYLEEPLIGDEIDETLE